MTTALLVLLLALISPSLSFSPIARRNHLSSPYVQSSLLYVSKDDSDPLSYFKSEVSLRNRLEELERRRKEQDVQDTQRQKTLLRDDSEGTFRERYQQQQQQEYSSRSSSSSGVDSTGVDVGSGGSNNSSSIPNRGVNGSIAPGRWKYLGGNYILRPLSVESNTVPPLGVIHFLGGAFVGAAPHVTYRYLLESLCDSGYVVVATPYRLDMDYVRSCDEILRKFDLAAIELAGQYGPVPVIGLGHSCGSLLHALITSLFPDAPRAANILISFNNKPAAEAIPGFGDVVVPLSKLVMGDSVEGTAVRDAVGRTRDLFSSAFDVYSNSLLLPPFLKRELVPLVQQSLEIVDQIPPLLRIIADGKSEFEPTPIDTKEVCRRMYRARRTLLLKFENDAIDESSSIESVLREANTIMRMKRPMVEMEVLLKELSGTHITPLTQNIIFDQPTEVPFPDLLAPVRGPVRENFLLTVNQVRDEILAFLESTFG